MARDHGFGCAQQMQGQMHVHVTELDPPVPLLGHFFRHLLVQVPPSPYSFPTRSRPVPCPGGVRYRTDPSPSFRLCNRASTARSVLVADFGP
ncbi:hypothetical protein DMT42_21680 [Streptomyces actuosus]|uniref:Uncharacterized protein n=1 Tax=Streptomyces actuosus TaxID=1885 RepID=A0A2U9P603_STRAS|nr:hypothetical protein DMT42_21680 [Streptomyces actuosus]